MAKYPQDPRWITARYDGKCSKCSAEIKHGDGAFYYPNTKAILGVRCGCANDAAAEFEAQRSDDDFNPCM